MLTFSITTLGCKINLYESAALSATLTFAGLTPIEGGEKSADRADIAVVNTCCVTTQAMKKSRLTIRKTAGKSRRKMAIIIGCYSTYDRIAITDALKNAGISENNFLIVGHLDDLHERVVEFVNRHDFVQSSKTTSPTTSNRPGGEKKHPAADANFDSESIKTRKTHSVKNNMAKLGDFGFVGRFPGRQRAFVKIQDGCDAFCSYCIVPYMRGRPSSPDIETVVEQCAGLVEIGHKEIVLSGVFIGAFGRQTAIRRRWPNDDRQPLAELIEQIGQIPNLRRLRISSIEPLDITGQFIAACLKTPAFAPHFHLPMQSGSANILKKMNRQYSPEDFLQAIDRINAAFDSPAVTTDVIVGFPGETEEDFGQTMSLAEKSRLSKMHIFPFSPIRGTSAWNHRNLCPPPAVVKDRIALLAKLDKKLSQAFRRQFVGKTVDGIVESGTGAIRTAITAHHESVFFSPPADSSDLTGALVELYINNVEQKGLSGRLISVKSP